MKINWFSPLPPQPTDIAHYTMRILDALTERADVVLWTNQGKVAPDITRRFRVRRFGTHNVRWDELNRADAIFYNIGNDPRYHEAIWKVSRRAPGIVVLHDARLQHFFGGILLHRRGGTAAYLRLMQNRYGANGLAAAQQYLDHTNKNSFILELAARYPLTGVALDNALAALVHSKQVYELLKNENSCARFYAPLPYSALTSDTATAPPRDASDPRRLICFGYTGPNRRLEFFLRALAGMEERDRFRLDIYGSLWDDGLVRRLIRRLGMSRLVRIHGFVAEAELDCALRNSDLAINLRFPTMGEASGSQLRIWSHKLPSLVTDVDWYARLPPEAVLFVRPEHETEDIQKHLLDLLADPARFRRIGAAGHNALVAQHAAGDYAETVFQIAKQMPALRSRAAAHRLTERAAIEAARWATSEAQSAEATTRLAKRVARATHELFEEREAERL